MKKLTLVYVATYLFIGGAGFAFLPAMTLALFLSNGDYGDVMPRAMGMFMLLASGLVINIIRFEEYRFYGYAILARSLIVLFLVYLYLKSLDPMFIVINAIVLVGLIPSWIVWLKERSAHA